MKTLIIFGLLLLAVAFVCALPGGDQMKPEDFVVPKALEEEGKKLKEKLDALNLPKTADGMADICKITDEAFKKSLNEFIDKVNAAGGKMPKPKC